MAILVYDIEWSANKKDIRSLPNEIRIDDDTFQNLMESYCEDKDEDFLYDEEGDMYITIPGNVIFNYITDMTGFCLEGFSWEQIKEEG